MELFRRLVLWLDNHRILSFFILAILITLVIFVNTVFSRSEGILTEPLKRGSIVQSVYGIGTITANHRYQVRLGVVSTINQLFIKEGDTVKKGSQLVQVDGVIYRAPFDGTITALPFMIGENVFAQAPILSFVNLQDRYLVVSLEQQGALHVQKGQKVKISFDTFRDQNYEGVVQSVYSNDSNFLARIDISQLPNRILPGMTADVAIIIQQKENVMLVPVAALVKSAVWVHSGHGMPTQVFIKTGIIDGAYAEVISDELKEGDQLIIRKKSN